MIVAGRSGSVISR